MGGLSGAYGSGDTWINSITKFLDAARTWSTANRGGSFPADVINVHYYSFGPGAPAPALSPEDDKVQAKLAAVVAYRDQHLPGMPVWWTEFGYDTYANSKLHAPTLGQNSAFVVQGQWLVRDLLVALAAGIERATLFELDDTCTPPASACDTQFATSGLLATPGSAPKPSWFFLATFRARLQTMVYGGELPSGQSDVRIARFKDTKTAGGALVVWAPTSKATVHAGYSALALPGGAASATAVALVDKQQNGVETALTPASGSVTLDVSETPTIVLYGPCRIVFTQRVTRLPLFGLASVPWARGWCALCFVLTAFALGACNPSGDAVALSQWTVFVGSAPGQAVTLPAHFDAQLGSDLRDSSSARHSRCPQRSARKG